MKPTMINIAGHKVMVVGVEGMGGVALVGQMQPYLAGVERLCCAYLAEHGGEPVGLEIHATPGKVRLVRVLGEWIWPPPMAGE